MKLETRDMERVFRISARGIDGDARIVPASLSSEAPVKRYFGNEVLVHSPEAINMERASRGLPMLFGHDRMQPIGKAKNVTIDSDNVMRADLHFSTNEKAKEVWRDVSEGFLADVSVFYRIDDYEEVDDGIRVTRWTPTEASIVSVPADPSVGVNRSIEDNQMSDENTSDAGTDNTATRQEEHDVKTNIHQFRIDREKERQRGAALESERRESIRSLFSKYEDKYGDDFSALREACERDASVTVDLAKQTILDAIAEGYISVDVSARQDPGSHFSDLPKFERKIPGQPRIEMGDDQVDKFSRAAEVVISVQANGVYTEEERSEAQKHEYYSMSVSELAREYLRITGRRGSGQKTDIIGTALQRDISHGSSHFAAVLENVSNKSMLDGFMQAPESWQQWVQTRNIPDFKPGSLLNMSLFSDLDMIKEGAQYTYGDMSDLKEPIQLATYGKLFGITRQALAGDDLNALGDIPRSMGLAAAYKIGDVVYSVLIANAVMLQDSTALFDAAHNNLVASGAPPSVATLNAAKVAMALQTDPQGKVLGIRTANLIVPVALETTAQTLIAAQYDPAAVAGTLTPNPFQGTMQVVSDHRLDSDSSAAWYTASARNTVVVGFLNGQQTPYLESKDGWSIDGVEYKVRIDAAAAAADFRGLYKNNGE